MFQSSSPVKISPSSPILSRNYKSKKRSCEIESKEATDKRKGSDWIKSLIEKTPEKPGNLNGDDELFLNSPDETKAKKDGFFEHFQKLLQSWQSNLNMWNHQMHLIWTEKSLSCSMSPTVNLNSPNSLSSIFRRSKSFVRSPYQRSPHQMSKKLEVDNKFSPVQARAPFDKSPPFLPIHVSIKNEPYSSAVSEEETSPGQGYLKKICRNSYDISPISSCNLSSLNANPKLPQKHLCLRILKVLKPLSSNGSYFKCAELDFCYQNQKGFLKDTNKSIQLKNYLVVLGHIDDGSSPKTLNVGDEVKIYAPWQMLNLASTSISTIFSSYFTVRPSDREEKPDSKKVTIKVPLASWSCSCTRDGHFIPSTCTGGTLLLANSGDVQKDLSTSVASKAQFDLVQDNSSKRLEQKQIWTVLDAIELCGGQSGIHVSVTARILRIFEFKNSQNDKSDDATVSCYTILGQDPSGAFFIVEVPNRPLVSNLSQLLDCGLGTIQTLTHLTVTERLTDAQNPGLFSLIHTLHRAYETAIRNNQSVCNLLPHGVLPQTFCYKFSVTLGMTKHTLITKTDGISLSQNAELSFESHTSNEFKQRRGTMTANVFYYVHPYLYANSDQTRTSGKNIENIFVKDFVNFPSWMRCSGTIMAVVKIKDIWNTKKGCFCIDKFTTFERCNESLLIPYQDCLKIIPEWTKSATESDLVILSRGVITYVHEDEALSWNECPRCNSSSLRPQEEGSQLVSCTSCKRKDLQPICKFSLQVSVLTKCHQTVIVKLFQTTIENLLRTCFSSLNQTYDSTSLLKSHLDPRICCVQSIAVRNKPSVLREMPY